MICDHISFYFSLTPQFHTLDVGIYRVFIKYCVFPKHPRKFATAPPLALVCAWLYKKGQPIGATVHSHRVEKFKGLLQRYVGEGGVPVNCEKKHNFS